MKVVVLPALGSPGGLFKFVGSVEDYVALSLINLGEDLANLDESLARDCDNIIVVFDSTHGINYSPVLTAKISEIVAQILRLRYNINVSLEIYNSDPYPPKSGSDKPKINVNKVFEKQVTEIEIPRLNDLKDFDSFSKNSRCVEEAKRNDKNLDNESTKNLRSVMDSELKRIINNVLASLYSPSPLALLYSCYDYQNYWESSNDRCSSDSKCIKDFQELLSKIKDMWIENVKIRDKCIERSISIKLNTIWSLLITDSVCTHVKNLIDKHQNPIYEINQNPISQAKNIIMFKLSLLKDLAENIYTRVNFALNYLIKHEISIIEYLSKDKIKENECREYREISELKTDENTDKQRSQRILERNLIAHAGLLRDFVKICKQNNELYIGYKDTETIEDIYNHLKNIFNKRSKKKGLDID
ncbi:MAG: TM1812 family CRISPR-associated protein [Ignisphaera sp.]